MTLHPLRINTLPKVLRVLAPLLAVLLLAGCAGIALREPMRVSVAGLEPLPGEGLEARFAIKLRVQNPNERGIDFDGVSVDLELAGQPFASGVSAQSGSVPRYGETLITVPVTVPFTALVRQLLGMGDRVPGDSIAYRLRGNLGGSGLIGATFDTSGELRLPRVDSGRRR